MLSILTAHHRALMLDFTYIVGSLIVSNTIVYHSVSDAVTDHDPKDRESPNAFYALDGCGSGFKSQQATGVCIHRSACK